MVQILRYKWLLLAGLGVILLYFFLRVYNLTILPIFADEAIYIRWAQVMRAEPTLRFVPLSDGKQPLFMWAVIPFLKLFEDPLIAGRMVSVLTGFGTLIGIFSLTFCLFKKPWLSLASSLIYAVSPFTVFFDRMALVDSMLSMFGVWTLFLGIVTAKTLRLDMAMLTGFALGGALLTKSPALFYSILLPLNIIFVRFMNKEKLHFSVVLKFMGLFMVIYIIGYAMYNVLRLGPNFELIDQRNKDYVSPLYHILASPLDPFLPYIDRIKEWVWIMGPAGLVLLAVGGLVFGLRYKFRETLFLSAWAFIPILVQSEFAKVITARYIFFSLPAIIIIASTVFLVRKKGLNLALYGILVFFLTHALFIDYRLLSAPESAPLPQSERSGYLEEWTAGGGIREIADFIRERQRENPDERIIIGTEGYFGTLPDGLQIYLTDLPRVTVIGVGVTISGVPEQLRNAKRAGDTVYLVVNSSRILNKFETDATKATQVGEGMGLKVMAAYPKPKRARTDTHQYIYFGERDYLYLFEVTEAVLLNHDEEEANSVI